MVRAPILCSLPGMRRLASSYAAATLCAAMCAFAAYAAPSEAIGPQTDAEREAHTLAPLTTRVEEVAPGVHIIRHPDATEDWPQGNTAVVIGDASVLVVDSAYLPSTARADLDIIRKLAPGKPIRYLVNTHWHFDHNQGNQVYADLVPGIDIIAHAETRRLMDANCPTFPKRVVSGTVSVEARKTLKDELEAGKKSDGQPLTDADKRRWRAQIDAREHEVAELSRFRYVPPTVTFEKALTLYLGRREVRILHLGRGNTPGDAVVFLPADRVLISGDLLVHPIPFAFNCYPSDWSRTLKQLAGLEPAIIVPGHGEVQRDRRFLQQVTALLDEIMAQAHKAAVEGKNLEETRKAIDLERFRKELAGDDPLRNEWFRDVLLTPIVERAFREAKGQQ